MTTEQTALQRLKEVCDKATPGPWLSSLGDVIKDTRRYICGKGHGECCHDPEVDGEVYALFLKAEGSEKDAAFIATARTALPALIELCKAQTWEMECYELHAFGHCGIHYKTPEADAELTASCTAATAAVEAAKARLEEVCVAKNTNHFQCFLRAEIERLEGQLERLAEQNIALMKQSLALNTEAAKLKELEDAAEEVIKELTDLPAYIAEYERDKLCMRPVSESSYALSQCRKRLEEARAKLEALK